MTKMKALKGVRYGLGNINLYRRRMLLGLYHLEALSSQFDGEPYMSCLDKLVKVRILCLDEVVLRSTRNMGGFPFFKRLYM